MYQDKITQAKSPWDFVGALGRVNNDEQLLREVVPLFLERMQVMMANIESALHEEDAEKLHMSSHTLRGSAGNILANGVMELADQLEQLAQAGNFVATGPVWGALQQESTDVRRVMTHWLEEGITPASRHHG